MLASTSEWKLQGHLHHTEALPRVAWYGTAHTATPMGLVSRWIQGCHFGPISSQEYADMSLRRLYHKEGRYDDDHRYRPTPRTPCHGGT